MISTMKYNCKDCKFKWEGNMDSFNQVLAHEKSHRPITENSEGY